MAFEAVRPARSYQTKLVISAGVYNNKEKMTPTISIEVGQELMDQCGWKRGDKIEVAEGTEQDNCLLQLRKGKTGFTLSGRGGSNYKDGQGGGNVRISFKHLIHHELKVETASLQPVNFQRFGSAITVDLQDLIQPKPQTKLL